jgi:hypothetical protein
VGAPFFLSISFGRFVHLQGCLPNNRSRILEAQITALKMIFPGNPPMTEVDKKTAVLEITIDKLSSIQIYSLVLKILAEHGG